MTYYDIAKSLFKEGSIEKPFPEHEYFFLKGGSYFIGCHRKILQFSDDTLYYAEYLYLDKNGLVIPVTSNGEPIEFMNDYFSIPNPNTEEFIDICYKVLTLIKQMSTRIKMNELNHDFNP